MKFAARLFCAIVVSTSFVFSYVSMDTSLKTAARLKALPAPTVERVEKETLVKETTLKETIILNLDDLSKETAFHLLRSTVRVDSGEGRGSGFFIFSGKRPEESKDTSYYSFIMTCAHVVHNATSVTINRFEYLDNKMLVGQVMIPGDVIFKDPVADVAIVMIKSDRAADHIVSMLTPAEFKSMTLYDPAYAVGCALGYPPFITKGNISSFNVPEGPARDHLMVSSSVMFGNSGGGVFTTDGKLIGMVQMMGGTPSGLVYSNMGFAIPVWALDKWMRHHYLGFVVDGSVGLDKLLDFVEKAKAKAERDRARKAEQKMLEDRMKSLETPEPTPK